MDKKRKKKSLKLKAEYLKLELEEKIEETAKYEKEFMDEILKLELEDLQEETPSNKQKTNSATVDVLDESSAESEKELEEQDKVEEKPEEIKKLWKQIALLTHPDRSGNDPEKVDKYKRAAAAWDDKNYAEIISIAEELGIDLPEDTIVDLHILENFINDLQGKIKENESSILRAWATAPQNKKEKILDLYLKSKGKKRKTAD
jgi:hypothetical protein